MNSSKYKTNPSSFVIVANGRHRCLWHIRVRWCSLDHSYATCFHSDIFCVIPSIQSLSVIETSPKLNSQDVNGGNKPKGLITSAKARGFIVVLWYFLGSLEGCKGSLQWESSKSTQERQPSLWRHQ